MEKRGWLEVLLKKSRKEEIDENSLRLYLICVLSVRKGGKGFVSSRRLKTYLGKDIFPEKISKLIRELENLELAEFSLSPGKGVSFKLLLPSHEGEN